MSRRGLLWGGSSAKWKISSAPYRSAAKVTLTGCVWKRLAPSSLSPWPSSPHGALLLQPQKWRTFSESGRGLKGDDISHIISWEHQGCMAVGALLPWFITPPVISFWRMANRTDTELLFVKHRCVCVCTCTHTQYTIRAFWVNHEHVHLLQTSLEPSHYDDG